MYLDNSILSHILRRFGQSKRTYCEFVNISAVSVTYVNFGFVEDIVKQLETRKPNSIRSL